MDLEKYIIDATLEVFASMIFIDIEPGLSATHHAAPPPVSDLTSIIGLAGDLKGILSIHCPAQVAMGITGAMLGMDVTELGDDAKDAVGEVANMIAGGLKVFLAGVEKKIELAIPTTAIGKGIRTGGLSGASRVMIPFSSSLGTFTVELRYIPA